MLARYRVIVKLMCLHLRLQNFKLFRSFRMTMDTIHANLCALDFSKMHVLDVIVTCSL